MSNAFIKFTDQWGIHRRHTTRNRPQQNGVAECADQTMGEDISAMLYEAQLPPSFWGEALAAQIHVWNRLPTSSLKRMTPHEAWFKCKPDISHLRVWGCLSYVCMFRRTRDVLFNHIWRNVCLLDIQVGTKVGSSTTQPHRNTLSVNVQNLTSVFFLALPSTRQHHQSISHLPTRLSHQLLPHCSI